MTTDNHSAVEANKKIQLANDMERAIDGQMSDTMGKYNGGCHLRCACRRSLALALCQLWLLQASSLVLSKISKFADQSSIVVQHCLSITF